MNSELVPLLVNIPRNLRVLVRVEAARREWTIAAFVVHALETTLTRHAREGNSAAR